MNTNFFEYEENRKRFLYNIAKAEEEIYRQIFMDYLQYKYNFTVQKAKDVLSLCVGEKKLDWVTLDKNAKRLIGGKENEK